jgi:FAD-linked oxidoreductase
VSIRRRRLLEGSAALLAAGLLPGCGRERGEPQSPMSYQPGKPLPWINWAGNQHCLPAARAAPAVEAELPELLRRTQGTVRAVGAGHSFSALVPTDDLLVSTDLLSGIASHDATTVQAEVWAGTRLHDLGPLLDALGQALPNMPDIDYIALGGGIATSAHATGTRWGSLSAYVTGLTLVTPAGEMLECSATQHAEVFQAARCSLGALGIVTRIRLQNLASYALTERTGVERTEDVLADLDRRFAAHRHFELMPLPHSDFCLTVTTDEAAPGDAPAGSDDLDAVFQIRSLWESVSWLPHAERVYDFLLERAMDEAGGRVRTGPWYTVLPHIRQVRFREMEYTVPAEAGPACVREILRTIRERRLPDCFPLEYRHTAADDIWLSMFEGRPGASISVHQFGDTDYRPYFAEIEPIFWKYEGRPHWGKLHTQDAGRLAALYPRHWQDFREVRRALDPAGRMLNAHLRHVLEV